MNAHEVPPTLASEENADEATLTKRFSREEDPFFTEHESFPDDETIEINVKVSTVWVNSESRKKLIMNHKTKVPKNGKMIVTALKE